MRNPTQPILEIDMENAGHHTSASRFEPSGLKKMTDINQSGIYIPEGRQRKLNISKNPNAPRMRYISYVSPEGKIFCSQFEVSSFFSQSENIKENFIDVKEMDFSVKNHFSITKKYPSNLENQIMRKVDYPMLDIDIENNQEKYKDIGYVFDLRIITEYSIIYLCKLCSYSCRGIIYACSHTSVHINKLSNKLSPNSVLPNEYDYFVCTACHSELVKIENLLIHLQSHNDVNISMTVVGIRYISEGSSRFHEIPLYCCEVCTFASLKYHNILDHLKDHTYEEIEAAYREKYQIYNNKCDENFLNYMCKDEDSGDSIQIINDESDRKLDKSYIFVSKNNNDVPIKLRVSESKMEK